MIATEEKKYSKVYIEISNICNLQCSFCPEVIRTKKMMDLPLFEKVIDEVSPLTDTVAFHLMGDPLVHPKLPEFVNICETKNMRIFFVTNGVLLREDKMNLLLRSPFRQVNFSLHSFFDNYPDRDPKDYLKNIFEFTERAFRERPDLYINYRLWNLNDVKGSLTNNSQMLQNVCEHFQVPLPKQVDVRNKKSILLKNRLYLHFDTEFIWPSLDLPVLGTQGRCYGLSSHFGILVDGTVVPCCLDKEAGIPLGNLKEQPIQDILMQARAQELLKGFRQKKLVESLCQRCNYIERFQ
ncbi:MAG: radical SAM/SPASM domain-containing protein [Bdellovibrionales bacterium]